MALCYFTLSPLRVNKENLAAQIFFEIQFCRMSQKTEVGIIVAVNSISHWLDDSLYVNGDDHNAFFKEYDCIFDCSIYNNLKIGTIDPYGTNYYGPDLIDTIIARLLKIKPTDYETLVEWLNAAKNITAFTYWGYSKLHIY